MKAVAFVLLVAAPVALAAPVPKAIKPPPVELTLVASDSNPDLVYLCAVNKTDEPVTWRTTTIPLAAFGLAFTDAKGLHLDADHPATLHSPFPPPGREHKLEPGGELAMAFSVSGCFPKGRPKGPVSVTASFKHGGKEYHSEPLAVK